MILRGIAYWCPTISLVDLASISMPAIGDSAATDNVVGMAMIRGLGSASAELRRDGRENSSERRSGEVMSCHSAIATALAVSITEPPPTATIPSGRQPSNNSSASNTQLDGECGRHAPYIVVPEGITARSDWTYREFNSEGLVNSRIDLMLSSARIGGSASRASISNVTRARRLKTCWKLVAVSFESSAVQLAE